MTAKSEQLKSQLRIGQTQLFGFHLQISILPSQILNILLACKIGSLPKVQVCALLHKLLTHLAQFILQLLDRLSQQFDLLALLKDVHLVALHTICERVEVETGLL